MRPLLLLCALVILAACNLQAQPVRVDSIMVIVNDVVITESEVKDSIMPALEVLYRQYGNQPAVFEQKRIELRRERIEELVARQLILYDFTNAGYNIPESIIEDNIQSRISKDFGDRTTLVKTLQEEGLTYEKYRKRIRENIIINALRDKHVSQGRLISPAKIEQYYLTNQTKFQVGDQVKLRMIVLKKTSENQEQTTLLAAEILKKIEQGASFSEMASVYSEGSQRQQGGDWDWVDRSTLRKELADVAFSLKTGEHSPVIDLEQACYIMLVEETRPAHMKALTDVREEIEKVLLMEEQERLHRQYIERLKKKAFIRYF